MGGREVLELVDEQVAAAPLHRGAERAVGENRLDRRVDLLVEVDDTAVAEGGAEAGEQLGESVDVVPRCLDLVRVAQPEADAARPSRYGPIGSTLARRRRCPGSNESTSLRTSRSSMTGGWRPRCSRSTQRPSELSVRTCGRERRGASRQLALGLLVVGDGEDRRRLVAAVDDEVAQPLGEHAGLAGPGRGDDPRRAAFVADGGALVGGEVGRRDRPTVGPRPAGRLRPTRRGSPHPTAAGIPRLARPAVDPGRRSVGERTSPIGRAVVAGSSSTTALPGSSRLALRAHHHTGAAVAAAVVVVRPHEEVQAVEPRLGRAASASTVRR